MAHTKEIKALNIWAEEQGFTVSKTNGGHFRYQYQTGVTFGPSTPGCRRSFLNTKAQLKRLLRGQTP